ncbi:LCP family protein [Cohnella yongneupensis]|uniref:LCP family protein n=1 Tax=Cohnella yongneupensis TaxID=425006 RepID=A0ABW0R1P2_9BACL
MKRKKWVKISLYSLLSVVVVAVIAGGYIWYALKHTMDAMYEPLPAKTWTQPVFEREEVKSDPVAVITDDNVATVDTQPVSADGQATSAEGTALSNTQPSPAGDKGKQATDDSKWDAIQAVKLDVEQVDRLLHPDLDKEDPFCILLLGVDERPGDRGRSDTMILLTVQPATNSVLGVSIPRDTRVLIPHRETYDKINHAYAFGGTSWAVEAVERLFGVPIAYYMKTNMEGMIDIVDTVGGVDVDNPFAFDVGSMKFPLGEQHLNGQEALAFVQMRKEDPHGDFGRNVRQRQVLSSAVDKVVSFRSLSKFPHILSELSNDVRTNLTFGNMVDLASDYRSSISNIVTLNLKGTGKMINGIYYYTVQPEDRKEIQDRMLEQLQAT